CQAEDGIRDRNVTGVQTCALPIWLRRQMAFCLEIDKEKFIGRQTYLSDGERKENDAEHAWHMAIMTLLLSEYDNEKIDVLKTMRSEERRVGKKSRNETERNSVIKK